MVSARVAVIDEEAHLSEALLHKLHRSWDWLVREHVDKRNCSRQEPRASEHAQSRAMERNISVGTAQPFAGADLRCSRTVVFSLVAGLRANQDTGDVTAGRAFIRDQSGVVLDRGDPHHVLHRGLAARAR
jgi:hypothetical protein